MTSGIGFGKTILFGEHFVVHGSPALVAGLGHYTKISIARSPDSLFHFIDKQPKFSRNIQPLTWEICKAPILRILNAANISDSLSFTMHGNLPIPYSGIGSSAATCVAIARALNNFYNLGWDNKKINELALIGEQEIHGTPSGIDNTASTYGGLFWFQKWKTSQVISPLQLTKPLNIILAESNVRTTTKEVVAAVQDFCKKKPETSKTIFNEYNLLVEQAMLAIKMNNTESIGSLMSKNHKLLQQLSVSCKELDSMVDLSIKSGALGAKLTGTGRGGLMLALAPDKDIQEKIARILEAAGYVTLSTQIG